METDKSPNMIGIMLDVALSTMREQGPVSIEFERGYLTAKELVDDYLQG